MSFFERGEVRRVILFVHPQLNLPSPPCCPILPSTFPKSDANLNLANDDGLYTPDSALVKALASLPLLGVLGSLAVVMGWI